MAQPIARSSASTFRGHAAISLTPSGLIGAGTAPSCYDEAIEQTSNSLVPSEPSLEMLIEMRAIACDDDELSNHGRRVVVPSHRRGREPLMTVACQGVRSHPVPIALVGGGSIRA